MARNKNFLDWTDFTTPASGRELQNNSIRKTLKYDIYQDKTKFKAVALTDMHPLSQEGADIVAGTAYDLDEIGTGDFASLKNIRWVFRARILGNDSPHNFIPDPCDTTYVRTTDDIAKAMSYIQMHTQFITPTDYEMDEGDDLVRQGDVVWVELDKNVSGYDLQMGRYVSKITAEHVGETSVMRRGRMRTTATEHVCDNMRDIFNERDAARIPTGDEGLISPPSDARVASVRIPVQEPTSPAVVALIPTIVGTESTVFGSPGLTDSMQLLPTTLEMGSLGHSVVHEPSHLRLVSPVVRSAWSKFYWPLVAMLAGSDLGTIGRLIPESKWASYLDGDAIRRGTSASGVARTGSGASELALVQRLNSAWRYRAPRSRCSHLGDRSILDYNEAIKNDPRRTDEIVRSTNPLNPLEVKALVENTAMRFGMQPPYEGLGYNEMDPRVFEFIRLMWDTPTVEMPQHCGGLLGPAGRQPTGPARRLAEGFSALGKCDPRMCYCWNNPGDQAWSAAYISSILRNIDPTFPGSFAHHFYVQAGLIGRGIKADTYNIGSINDALSRTPVSFSYIGPHWQTFSLTDETVQINVGDVLVEDKHYPGSSWPSSHGDLVWKITGFPGEEMLWLAGGNLSNTNRTDIQIPAPNRLVGKNGVLAKPLHGYASRCAWYKVVLKKMI